MKDNGKPGKNNSINKNNIHGMWIGYDLSERRKQAHLSSLLWILYIRLIKKKRTKSLKKETVFSNSLSFQEERNHMNKWITDIPPRFLEYLNSRYQEICYICWFHLKESVASVDPIWRNLLTPSEGICCLCWSHLASDANYFVFWASIVRLACQRPTHLWLIFQVDRGKKTQ